MRYLMTRPQNMMSQMDSLMDDFFTLGNNVSSQSPLVNIREEKDQYVIEAELPGFSEKDLTVNVKDNLLTLKASKEEEVQKTEVKYLLRERKSRSFERSFVLPRDVDSKQIKAAFEQGVLTVELAKKEEAKPFSIKINKK